MLRSIHMNHALHSWERTRKYFILRTRFSMHHLIRHVFFFIPLLNPPSFIAIPYFLESNTESNCLPTFIQNVHMI